MFQGYDFTQPTSTFQHLINLLALSQERGWIDIAAATDNLLDLLKRKVDEVRADSETISTGLERDGSETGISQQVMF